MSTLTIEVKTTQTMDGIYVLTKDEELYFITASYDTDPVNPHEEYGTIELVTTKNRYFWGDITCDDPRTELDSRREIGQVIYRPVLRVNRIIVADTVRVLRVIQLRRLSSRRPELVPLVRVSRKYRAEINDIDPDIRKVRKHLCRRGKRPLIRERARINLVYDAPLKVRRRRMYCHF